MIQNHHIPNVTSPSRLMTSADVQKGSEQESTSVVGFLTDLLGGFKKQKTEMNAELSNSMMFKRPDGIKSPQRSMFSSGMKFDLDSLLNP